MTQNNPAKDIRDTLVNDDGVTTAIYIGSEPSTPDECVTLYNTSGDEPPSPKYLLDHPGLQVRSRANSYETAYTNILQVFDLLVGRAAFTKNTTRYTGIIALTNIFDLGQDENRRRILVCNLKMFVEPAAGSQNRKSI
jgi:hypothetical protein